MQHNQQLKLVIQIPCFNEESTLGVTLADLPRELPGIGTIEWLIVDDGSEDRTVEVAEESGVHHVARHPKNLGLARAFMTGLEASLKAGADIIVNTDADNQYCASDIPKLIQPILDGTADIVIGARPIDDIEHFSLLKRFLQKLGSAFVRFVSNTDVQDAPSGFRAYSRSAAQRMNVFSEYTYTLETIIQSGYKGIAVTNVPIRTNDDLRPSRLVKSISSYVRRSLVTMLRVSIIYKPLRFFFWLGSVPMLAGLLLCLRWLWWFVYTDTTRTRLPSLMAAAILILLGAQLWSLGVLADLLSVNRRISEDVQERVRRLESDGSE